MNFRRPRRAPVPLRSLRPRDFRHALPSARRPHLRREVLDLALLAERAQDGGAVAPRAARFALRVEAEEDDRVMQPVDSLDPSVAGLDGDRDRLRERGVRFLEPPVRRSRIPRFPRAIPSARRLPTSRAMARARRAASAALRYRPGVDGDGGVEEFLGVGVEAGGFVGAAAFLEEGGEAAEGAVTP